jgi:hypothetical protein
LGGRFIEDILFDFVRGVREGEDRLKSILLFKIENLVLKEARPCGAYKEQILS